MTTETATATKLNWSTLKYIDTSPRLLQYRIEHPRPETAALRLGRAIHCAVLEPEKFDTRWLPLEPCAATKKPKKAEKVGEVCGSTGSLYHEGAWYCKVRGHAPEGAGDPPEGVEVITDDERALVETCAESVRGHREAMKILTGGHAEERLEWTHAETGVACRGRLDYLRRDCVVDLKSTRRETVREFVRDAAQGLYHAQLAWYHDGAIAAGRLPEDAPPPYIISVSTTEPYDVACYQLELTAYQAGQIKYRDLILAYKQCCDADYWPGIAPDLLMLDLPPWAGGMQGSEEGISEEW